MSNDTVDQYIFVVHTNSYAGNFEREMTAYLTGIIGDCGVGKKYANEFEEDHGSEQVAADFAEFIEQVADEHGCERPCSIWSTPGRVNDGYGNCSDGTHGYPAYESVAIFFWEKPTDEMVALMTARANSFAEKKHNSNTSRSGRQMKILGFQLLHKKTSTSIIAETVEVSI